MKNYVGQRCGTRIVIAVLPRAGRYDPTVVEWRCDCGETGMGRGATLRRTDTCSTCAKRENGQNNTKHGATKGGKSTKLYSTWAGMWQRCRGTSGPTHKRLYKDKGITVCDEWQDFAVFRDWALAHGYVDGLTIDRIIPVGDTSLGTANGSLRRRIRGVSISYGVDINTTRRLWKCSGI